MRKGKVHLVGAGPGDPDLITLKGLKILRQSDVVIYDRLVDRRILQYANPSSELICVDELSKKNRLLVNKAKQGKKVLRLKNGDPFIFGRTNQELKNLVKERIEFSVVPGVTAANAASCQIGVPLTSKDFASSVIFITAREAPGKKKSLIDWKSAAQSGTIALYMAVGNIDKITQRLIASGKSKNTPVAVITNISKIDQRAIIGKLKNIAHKVKKEKIHPPAIVIIGKVVDKEKAFDWFRKTKKVLFTGLSTERFYEKGLIFHLPLIEIKPLDSYKKLDTMIIKLYKFDWLVFTSRYGVIYFFQRLFKLGYDARSLNGKKIAAIGGSTRDKLKEFGVLADLVPKKESSRGLLEEFRRINIRHKKILLPRSDIADKGLTKGLGICGAEVYPSVAYRNVMPGNLPDLNLRDFNEIMFTSPSTVRNFKKRYKKVPRTIKVRCIGGVTLKEAKKCKILN